MGWIANTIGAVALGASCAYGGIRYQQYNDSLRPFEIKEEKGNYIFIDKEKEKQFLAKDISERYTQVDSLLKKVNIYESELLKKENTIHKMRETIDNLDSILE